MMHVTPPCRSDSKIKELKEKLLRGKGQPNLSKVDDIHVICCVLKDFLRELKEPLVTFDLHGAFTLAAGEILAHLKACMWVRSVLFRVSSLQHHFLMWWRLMTTASTRSVVMLSI